MQDFKKLAAWQKSMVAARHCFEATKHLPREQRYGLQSQMRRAAISIPSNIAEGAGRRSNREFARFLRIAYGSSCELETQALLALDLDLGSSLQLTRLLTMIDEIQRILTKLIDRVLEDTN
jgi:four helix bundle protein